MAAIYYITYANILPTNITTRNSYLQYYYFADTLLLYNAIRANNLLTNPITKYLLSL